MITAKEAREQSATKRATIDKEAYRHLKELIETEINCTVQEGSYSCFVVIKPLYAGSTLFSDAILDKVIRELEIEGYTTGKSIQYPSNQLTGSGIGNVYSYEGRLEISW